MNNYYNDDAYMFIKEKHEITAGSTVEYKSKKLYRIPNVVLLVENQALYIYIIALSE
jgi:hypothetical protein